MEVWMRGKPRGFVALEKSQINFNLSEVSIPTSLWHLRQSLPKQTKFTHYSIGVATFLKLQPAGSYLLFVCNYCSMVLLAILLDKVGAQAPAPLQYEHTNNPSHSVTVGKLDQRLVLCPNTHGTCESTSSWFRNTLSHLQQWLWGTMWQQINMWSLARADFLELQWLDLLVCSI